MEGAVRISHEPDGLDRDIGSKRSAVDEIGQRVADSLPSVDTEASEPRSEHCFGTAARLSNVATLS